MTIDAMGCQTEIAAQIISQESEYVLSLKGNQGSLHKDVADYFYWAERHGFKEIEYDYTKTLEKGHGRIETRRCCATEEVDWLWQKEKWAGLRSIVMVESIGEIIGKKASIERRYFISSLPANAKETLRVIRSHWEIENSLHWLLDVAFREDHCQIKDANGAENMAILRHFVLNLLKQEISCKRGIKAKRLKAGWDEGYLLRVLQI